jgi:Na+/proline symporter
MKLTTADWLIIVAYFVLSLLIGLYYTRRAGKNVEEYFLADRSIPWWLAGTSMVATTFAADTPLAVTGMVANHGVAGNWLWWNFVMSGMLTVFFYARLWRRAGVMTDVEFTEIRYAGKAAAFLRGFRALYLGIPINCIILGWVTLGMAKVIELSLGVGKWQAILICMSVTAFYSVLSGYWGVLVTDAVQFVIAMVGSIALAYFGLSVVGGIDGLIASLNKQYGNADQLLAVWPGTDSAWMPLSTLLVYLGVQWWASWYPGAEPGGGGYVAQRIFSAKNEKHSLLATLWFSIAHYALRPWPWILVALCSMALYPDLADKESGYVRVMVDHLPPLWRGLLLSSFAAAYMSTVATQLNWGASYLVNDCYRRFIRQDADPQHYVVISRLATVVITLIAMVVAYYLQSVEGAWKILISLGAGTGLVYILRWFWWRINAWSEISAMAGALVVSLIVQQFPQFNANDPHGFAASMMITVSVTTLIWLSVTFMTAPESDETLRSFYARVEPGGPGWRRIAQQLGGKPARGLGDLFLSWIFGCALIYLFLIGIGKIVFRQWLSGAGYIVLGLLAGFVIFQLLQRRGWESLGDRRMAGHSPVK